MELAPFQKEGRDFLASREVALLADQMRLGKTAQAIAAADKIGAKRILVVCPSTAKITWQREFAKWSDRDRSIQIVYGTDATICSGAEIVIINYDLIWRPEIKKQLLKLKFSVAMVDECHLLAGRNSKRTKAMLHSNLRTPLLSVCVYKWFISGTPLLNRPLDMYPIFASCAPEVIAPYKSYKAYTRHFCGGYWDGIQWVDKGATHMKELGKRLDTFMLRRLRADVLGEIPPNFQIIPIEAKGSTVKTYVAEELKWEKGDADYQNLDEGEYIATVRRELGLYKIPVALKYIRHVLTTEDKLVVFAYHREVLQELHKAIDNSVLLYGGMTPSVKQNAIDAFKDDPDCKVFIGQITAAGVAIDLSSANNILFVESSWVPGEIDQASDRCSGFNQDLEVRAQFMVIEDSLEEHMLRTVIEKKNTIGKIVDRKD
mgnify:CR=1 FL=1